MRLPLIAPSDLTSEQRPIYEDMRAGIAKNFQGFQQHQREWRVDGAMESMAA